MKEVLPWVALLRKCRGVQTELLKDFVRSYINLLIKLRLTDDALMNEMYMAMSYLLLERLGEEGVKMKKDVKESDVCIECGATVVGDDLNFDSEENCYCPECYQSVWGSSYRGEEA